VYKVKGAGSVRLENNTMTGNTVANYYEDGHSGPAGQ